MVLDKSISGSSSGAAGDIPEGQEFLNLDLSLSTGSAFHMPQLRPDHQPPPPLPDYLNSPVLLPAPLPCPFGFTMPSDASTSSWPFTAPIPQPPLVFQMPQLQQDMPVQILQPAHNGEPSNSNAVVSHSPRQRGRVGGAVGALSKKGKAGTVTPPFPWATDKRAMIHSYSYLMTEGMRRIRGEVVCKRCERKYEVQYDLAEKFRELSEYILTNRSRMHDRAPDRWLNPALLDCRHCEQTGCVKPVPTKKKSINWLFLLLGQLLGCCKLSELKYFCKHTSNHRTGAKDRVLYLTYMGLCHQLDPTGTFEVLK